MIRIIAQVISMTALVFLCVPSSCHGACSCSGSFYSDGSPEQELYTNRSQMLVDEHNEQQEISYTLGMTKFASCSEEERLECSTGLQISSEMRKVLASLQQSSSQSGIDCFGDLSFVYDIIDTFKNRQSHQAQIRQSSNSLIDYRRLGVKDQGSCNSSWAYAATQLLEAQRLVHDSVDSFSERTILTCGEQAQDDRVCRGGMAFEGLEVVKKLGGIMPAEAKGASSCEYEEQNAQKMPDLNAALCVGTRTIAVEELKKWIQTRGPVVVPMRANNDFFLYRAGIYSPKKCSGDLRDLNHEVLLVDFGFDEKTGFDYWVVKNSWGTDWGEEGYARIQMGVCGIGRYATLARFGN